MTRTMPQRSDVVILREINLGAHSLFIMSDQSIDVMRGEEASYVAENVLSFDNCEAYRLMLSLEEMFKEVRK